MIEGAIHGVMAFLKCCSGLSDLQDLIMPTTSSDLKDIKQTWL
jgi:hypothetical protein